MSWHQTIISAPILLGISKLLYTVNETGDDMLNIAGWLVLCDDPRIS